MQCLNLEHHNTFFASHFVKSERLSRFQKRRSK